VDYETGVVYSVTSSFNGPLAAVSYQPGPGAPDIEPDVEVGGNIIEVSISPCS